MATSEVLRAIDEWMQPMRDEYRGLRMATNLLDRQVLEEWNRDGRLFEMIPAKLVFTDSWTKADKYSGGVDAVTLRALLRHAGQHGHDIGAIDVKQAFLSAPLLSRGVPIVVGTPSMFRQMGISEEEYWVVHHALYGLTTSPRSWSVFRDDTLKTLELVAQGCKDHSSGQRPQCVGSLW